MHLTKLKSAIKKHKLKIPFFLVLILYTTTSACTTMSQASRTTVNNETSLPTTKSALLNYRKVSQEIQSVVVKMKRDGITPENTEQHEMAAYTTPFVKVDKIGSIHAYICLRAFDRMFIAKLKEYGVVIELVNRDLKIIQAWIPFYALERIVDFDFIEYIRPPDYIAQ